MRDRLSHIPPNDDEIQKSISDRTEKRIKTMRTMSHDDQSVTCTFSRAEYLTLVELAHFVFTQYEKLDTIQLDLEKAEIKQLVSELENCTPAW